MTRPTQTDIRHIIQADFRAVGIHPGTSVRSLALRAPAAPADDEAMEWVLSTELPATVWDWDRYEFVSEVLLADGMLVPASGQVPLLDSHNRYSALDVIGHVREFAETVIGDYPARTGQARFAADEKSQTIKQKVIDGHLSDGSVGYQVTKSIWIPEGMTVNVSGKSFIGPLKVSTQWSLKEFSVTPIGADVLAKVRRMCGG
jgi:hypothetical protein